ncbi:bifunctional riboflavin kinase/FAD synthetase [Paenibacillus sp. GCM10012307]|uniref:Riboflavin biosynthesis protein n=1 Tax=Paenibacillus roseus TaxID=2798579 RepID=A0A934JAS9_9BACL|nr:bifunctional riboflavin kinase/FAD synthetase [Paenibacillus roseus]
MEIISLKYPLSAESGLPGAIQPQVLAIGQFDGVHLGHQQVISVAVAEAREAGLKAAVMTFDPHPRDVLGQAGQNISCLTSLHDKLEQFERLGIDTAYIFHFDSRFATISPEQFVEEVLRELQVKRAVVGFDFSFGHLGSGTPELLSKLGASFMQVDIVEPFLIQETKVSSTRIREYIAAGGVDQAALLLGRPYSIVGTVEHGDGRGRTIGFPTANVTPGSNYALPKLGVYAVLFHTGGEVFGGVMNVGVKPTFETDLAEPTYEIHIFDFNRDIYGMKVQVDLLSFLRPEQRFNSVQELIDRIKTDSDNARKLVEPVLAKERAGSPTEGK